jgi:hypothetical protein
MISVSLSGRIIRHTKRKARESNPHLACEIRVSSAARQTVIRLPSVITLAPVDRRGIEPRLPGCKPSVFPLDQRPVYPKGPFGNRTRSSSLPRRRAAGTPTDHFAIVIPDGVEPSLSWLSPRRLRRWTTGSPVTEAGIEPAITRLSTLPLCQFAYPVASGGSGCCTRRSRLMRPG